MGGANYSYAALGVHIAIKQQIFELPMSSAEIIPVRSFAIFRSPACTCYCRSRISSGALSLSMSDFAVKTWSVASSSHNQLAGHPEVNR